VKRLRRFWHRLRATLTGARGGDEFADEIEGHLQMQTEDDLRLGMSPDAARRAAALKFGSVESAKGSWRDQRVLPLLESVPGDVRFAGRGLVKEPGFAGVCVLTLALAIGASSAIFSVVNAVLIRPLPYPDADQLVQVWETNPRANRWGDWASYPDFDDWRRENRVFESMAAFRYGLFRLTDGEYPEMLVGVRVTPELFSVLRVNPVSGRPFLRDEADKGRNDVAILSHGLWQRTFDSDAGVVGKTILIDGRNHLVVGVMPQGFSFPANIQAGARVPDVWIPLAGDLARGSHNYRVIARLKPDRTVQHAQTEMERLAQFVAQVDPGHRGRGATAAGLQEHTVRAVRPALLVLVGAIVLVLVIACTNVASLLLARGLARQKETALRLALGARPIRLLQQSLTESVVLGLIGGAAGLLVAFVGVRFLIDLGPAVPLVKEASIDLRVLGFTFLTALTTGVAFGVIPTFQALKVQANDALKERGVGQGGSAGRLRMRAVLTVAEIALALMLLIGAGLLVRSFIQLRSVDVGFDAQRLLTASLRAPSAASTDPDRITAFFQDVIGRIERIPGARAVAAASAVPLLSNETSPFRVDGGVSPEVGQDAVYAEQPKITPSYFRTMGMRLMRGREFTGMDTRTSQPVAIVSEGLANTYWPGEDPVGKRLRIDDQQWRSIVGIVPDVRHDGLERPSRPTIYIPLAQYPRDQLTLLVRTDSDPASFVGATRRAVMDVDKNQPLFGIQTMEQTLSESVSLERFLMILVGVFAGMAVVLGTVGIYGVLAYFVRQRRQEIGTRIALGANRSQVVWLIVKQAALLALAGVGIGVLGSLALSRTLSGMLFGVSATDLWTFSVVPALLFLVVLAASFLPARMAASVEPIIALRNE
jgi:predicted permease